MQNAPRTGTIAAKKSGFRCWCWPSRGARHIRTSCPASKRDWPGLTPCASVRRDETGTAGSGPGVFLDRWQSADIAAGPSSPPATSFGTALGATVSGLRMCGVKGLLATLEQTMSLPRLTCPLTGPGLAASLTWAQGSCELPTAKSRTRRLLPPLRGAFLDHDTPRCRFPIQPTPIRTRFQARRLGATWLEPTDNNLVPTSLEQSYPRRLLLTSVEGGLQLLATSACSKLLRLLPSCSSRASRMRRTMREKDKIFS